MPDQQKILEITSKLISFKSISPHQAGCIDYLQGLLSKIGFTITRLDRNETSNIVAMIGNDGPLFAYAGHIDVVPSGDLDKWTFDPFTLGDRDGWLYGRGIADMKGGIAAFIGAVTKYIQTDFDPNKARITLLITSDEESSAVDGTPVMVEYLKSQDIIIDYCLIGEPSAKENLGDIIKIGRRGSLTGYIEVFGKQGHIAYPDECINPIHGFTPALNELIKVQWDNGNNMFPPTSLQVVNINSGLGVANVIPNSLTANFNFRYNNLHNALDLEQKVAVILDKHNIQYAIRWVYSAKPFYTKPGKLLQVIDQSIKQQLNLTPQQKTDGGTSDGRFLIDISHEIIEFGLSNIYIHQIDERIKTKDLYNLADTYFLILNKIFND